MNKIFKTFDLTNLCVLKIQRKVEGLPLCSVSEVVFLDKTKTSLKNADKPKKANTSTETFGWENKAWENLFSSSNSRRNI